MNEIKKIFNEYKLEDLFLFIKSNCFVNNISYLDYIFNDDSIKFINNNKLSFELTNCFYDSYCRMIKYKIDEYTKEDKQVLKQILLNFINEKYDYNKIKLVYKSKDSNDNDSFYILPVQCEENLFLALVIPKSIVKIKKIDSFVQQENKTKKIGGKK